MSKVKLMLEVISDVRSLANSLQAVCDAMMENEPIPAKEPKAKKPTPKKEITLEEVRAKLAELSQSGKTAQVRDLIKKYGGTKLSDIDATHYFDILKDVEDIANE